MIALKQGDLESALGLWSRHGKDIIYYLIDQGNFFLRNGEHEVALEYTYGSQYCALQARQRLTICLCRADKRDRALAEAQELSKIAPADIPFHSWDLQLIQNWSHLCEPAQ